MFGINDKDEYFVYDNERDENKIRVLEIITCKYSSAGNRKYQQDAVYVSEGKKIAANKETRLLAAVCDGMGGMAAGERASTTAIKMLTDGFKKIEKEPNINIPMFFRSGIRAIDSVINSFPKENGKGSGTTMVAVITECNRLYWASVGDSRIYLLRGDEIKLVTRDHNYYLRLQQMVEQGQISAEQAENEKQKEALISFLGIGNVTLMDVIDKPFEMRSGDMVVLCSDGVTKTLSKEKIKRILTNESVEIQQKAKILVEAAIRENTRSQDNTSVVILQYIEK